MTTVTVKASQTYDVKIGRGLLDTLGEEAARAFQGRTVCIVSDSNVAPHYLSQATHSLERAGYDGTLTIEADIPENWHKACRQVMEVLEK